MTTKYSYHVYLEFIDYDTPKFPKTINAVIQFDRKVLDQDDYSALKKFIVDEYHLRIDPYMVVITSLSYLGSTEE